MCSDEEIQWRSSSCSIHECEATDETMGMAPSRRKGDPTRMVRQYSRTQSSSSSAPLDEQLHIIEHTVQYLSTSRHLWNNQSKLPFNTVYPFVMDRMRACCQGLTALRPQLGGPACLPAAMDIARFHSWALGRCLVKDTQPPVFDEYLHIKALIQSLESALTVAAEKEDPVSHHLNLRLHLDAPTLRTCPNPNLLPLHHSLSTIGMQGVKPSRPSW